MAASQQDRTDCAAQDPSRAIPACSRVIADQDESIQNRSGAYLLRAAAYLAQGNTTRAIADYGEAIKLTPRNATAYVRRAIAYLRDGDRDHAVLDYAIAEKIDPIGVAQMAAGNPDVEAVAATARTSPPSPAALALIMDQLAKSTQPESAPVRPPQPPTSTPPPPRAKLWNSVAAAIWRVRGRVHVAVGYSGARSSDWDARQRAIDACRDAGGRDCQSKGVWDSGCVYITTGSSRSRAGWGSGDTIAEAVRRCEGQGLSCKQPIGGCVE
ncbi:MAG TPA: tetratricopeptide repeat protein [Xanthobacteraceae bacterium]|nr:tetratricopeptide repeat protein [Xanthobacteraceae bacterium]